jgi:hypothetical protein
MEGDEIATSASRKTLLVRTVFLSGEGLYAVRSHMKMQRRGSGGQRGESLMGICEKVPRLTNKNDADCGTAFVIIT